MAAAAAYAGLRIAAPSGRWRSASPRHRPVRRRPRPVRTPWTRRPRRWCRACWSGTTPKPYGRATLRLLREALERFRAATPVEDGPEADSDDDALLGDDEAASMILGLQDRAARDEAAEWMEPAARRPGGAAVAGARPALRGAVRASTPPRR